MGVYIPPGFGQAIVEMRQTGSTRVAQFSWGFANSTDASAGVAAAGIRNQIDDAGMLLAPTSYVAGWSFERLVVSLGTTAGPFTAESAVGVVGTLTGEAAPPQVAFLVRKATTLGGRWGRGRMYLPPAFASETDITQQGTLTTSRYGALKTIVDNTLAALQAGAYPVRLLHSHDLPGPSTVSSWTLQQLVATQRRRVRK